MNDHMNAPSAANEVFAGEIEKLGEVARLHGLSITPADVREIVEARNAALDDCGTVEFGPGPAAALVWALCDSPHIQKEDFVSTICEMQALFYRFKADWASAIPDEALVKAMAERFNGECEGSLELMSDWNPRRNALSPKA
ncbi:MAG: DUF6323 family protein [Clostridia bacterium]|nr:DUF6323 family protein [Clostridia bacterium]